MVGTALATFGVTRKPPVLNHANLRQRTADLLSYLGHNEAALVHYNARRRRGEPIAGASASTLPHPEARQAPIPATQSAGEGQGGEAKSVVC